MTERYNCPILTEKRKLLGKKNQQQQSLRDLWYCQHANKRPRISVMNIPEKEKGKKKMVRMKNMKTSKINNFPD